MTRAIRLVCAAGLFWVLAAPAAQGAFVRPDVRWVWPPQQAEPSPYYDVIYDGEGLEANDITVVADPSRTLITITDPGVAMHGAGLGIPVDPTGGRVMASWSCQTAGTSAATCLATPGTQCWSLGCSDIPGPVTFNGRLKIAGNRGDDHIKILSGPMPATVWGVFGNDTIDVANGRIDNVDCGDGADTVTADPGDLVKADCEFVARS